MLDKLLVVLFLLPIVLNAQLNPNWQHLDPYKDSILGVSSYRAHEFLKNKKSKQVIVAIIDNGVELTHHDLQGKFWVNPNEIAGNGIDDDKNGYIDDINGWNFLGNQNGQNIKRETTELTRLYATLSKKYGNIDINKLKSKELKDYQEFQKVKAAYLKVLNAKKDEINLYQNILLNCKEADKTLNNYFNKNTYSETDLLSIPDTAKNAFEAGKYMLKVYRANLNIPKLEVLIDNNKQDIATRLNPDFNIRKEIIGDDLNNLNDNKYGNNHVDAQSPFHGTGVAGIIGGLHNEIGIDGIAANVKLMILRALPNGDEQDKDVALAILYAINNHADIINCSFGKAWSAHPELVEYAMKKAEKAGVLIVHAAGNDGQNNDSISTFPTGFYSDGSRAKNWLNVGASQAKDDENLIAYFSNYGKESVDVFAPGIEINTCILNNKYDLSSGTSIAAPIVSGIAAQLKSFYPKLNAVELKEILIKSAYHPKTKSIILQDKPEKRFSLEELSVSGGIANLYNAIILIEKEYSK